MVPTYTDILDLLFSVNATEVSADVLQNCNGSDQNSRCSVPRCRAEQSAYQNLIQVLFWHQKSTNPNQRSRPKLGVFAPHPKP